MRPRKREREIAAITAQEMISVCVSIGGLAPASRNASGAVTARWEEQGREEPSREEGRFDDENKREK